MFSTLRTRFGIPGVISVMALVFAMFGGAYAASNSSDGGKATASAKAKQGPRGKTGKTGPAGPAGPAGAKGDTGAAGANGTSGAPGASGQSVTGTPIAAGGACGPGVSGVKYTLDVTSTNICNGKNGTNGQTGFTETLPPGKTETGIFGTGISAGEGVHAFSISFPIPLVEAPEAVIVGSQEFSNEAAGCPGRGGTPPPTSNYEPTIPEADPGKLCIYIDSLAEAKLQPNTPRVPSYSPQDEFWSVVHGASQTGTILEFACEEFCNVNGTWAVTAPEV